MEYKKDDDQNRDRNPEKPEKAVFHLIPPVGFTDDHLGWRQRQKSIGNYLP